MEKLIRVYIEKAENEIILVESLFKISSDNFMKEKLEINFKETFYSAVISHSYYCIFYCVKAYLLSKDIKLPEQGQHQTAYYKFRKFVLEGAIEKELLKIYDDLIIKADELLNLFEHEKLKRGHFVYKTTAQANIEPAKESLDNAGIFFKSINKIIEVME
jgi:uncharacterized protein (UPF0332 family)